MVDQGLLNLLKRFLSWSFLQVFWQLKEEVFELGFQLNVVIGELVLECIQIFGFVVMRFQF